MKIKLEVVRQAFNDYWKAVQYKGQGPFQYRGAYLIVPNDKNHKILLNAEETVAKEKWNDKYKKILEKANKDSKLQFLVDGNTKEYDGYAGMIAFKATRNEQKGRPLILNRDKSVLTQSDGKPYSGCYVNVTAEVWAQDNDFGQCIRAQLLAVQFAKDGDAFAAGGVANPDDFDELSDQGDDGLI